jgi:hypothetical protein
MNYQVLARKWRPSKFTEVVGQEHVVKTLMNALQHGRLHHAYLFTGTRGVGKTTIARILAKAINCDNLKSFNPCGQCQSCRELDEGRFLDLIEVDAASRTKVKKLLCPTNTAKVLGHERYYCVEIEKPPAMPEANFALSVAYIRLLDLWHEKVAIAIDQNLKAAVLFVYAVPPVGPPPVT